MNDKIKPIKVYNAIGLCAHKFCSNKPTYYFEKKISGIPLLIVLCEKHAKEYSLFLDKVDEVKSKVSHIINKMIGDER
ncbi:MAG TPA: hypothetical protein VJ962_04245 [Clostridia bacterium]|nr:hypothetical protein [Clostridia bacterium]